MIQANAIITGRPAFTAHRAGQRNSKIATTNGIRFRVDECAIVPDVPDDAVPLRAAPGPKEYAIANLKHTICHIAYIHWPSDQN